MGHQRIGRLPRTFHRKVLLALRSETPDADAVASATIRAAQTRLAELKDETAVPYCYWVLVRLTSAAYTGDFVGAAAVFGVRVAPRDSAIGFIARLSTEVADSLRRQPGAGPFADLAVESLRSTLIDTIALQGRSLFGSPTEDFARACRHFATESGFSRATAWYREALALAERERLTWDASQVRVSLAHVALGGQRVAEAAGLFTQALSMRPEGFAWMAHRWLTGAAILAALCGQAERARRLLGAADEHRQADVLRRTHRLDVDEYQRCTAAVRAHLDADRFTTARIEGRALSLDQAIAEALATMRAARDAADPPVPTSAAAPH
jgi:hypothetical protein